MQNFKNKLHDFEAHPPKETWAKISSELDNEKVIQLPGIRRRSRLLFYGLTAAASLLILLIVNVFNNSTTVPSNDKAAMVSSTQPAVNNNDSVNQNKQLLENIINTPASQKLLASNFQKNNGNQKKYITVAGPEGQPVKISPKVATLILSADNQYPPKPIWNEKIDEWQQIMLNNTTSASPAGLMDLMQSASGM